MNAPPKPGGWTPRATPEATGPLRATIRRLDAWLRRNLGFVEFAASPACILRVVITRAEAEIRLSDGVVIKRGDPILDIHFWNERMPQSASTQGLGWGGRFGRQLMRSLGELAAALETDPRLGDAVAVRGRLAFAGERSLEDMRRFGAWFDFEQHPSPRLSLSRRLHDTAEDIWLLALAWTFNPGCLSQRSVVRRREDLWISREKMLVRHGPRRRESA